MFLYFTKNNSINVKFKLRKNHIYLLIGVIYEKTMC